MHAHRCVCFHKQRKQYDVNSGYIWGAEWERPRVRQLTRFLNVSVLLELGQSEYIIFIVQMTDT